MKNASARQMWGDYLDAHLEDAFVEAPKVIHFRTNENDANQSAKLVKQGAITATSYALLGLQYRKEPIPRIGDFMVITDWAGRAQCIVRTTSIQYKPFFNIDGDFVRKEANSNNLADWKKSRWEEYTQELEPFERVPRDSMIVVCQEFEKVFE